MPDLGLESTPRLSSGTEIAEIKFLAEGHTAAGSWPTSQPLRRNHGVCTSWRGRISLDRDVISGAIGGVESHIPAGRRERNIVPV